MKFAFDAGTPGTAPKDWGAWLDGMSYKDYIEKILGYSPAMTAYMAMVGAAGAFGCSASAFSAYGAYHFAYPGTGGFCGDRTRPRLTSSQSCAPPSPFSACK